MRVKATVLCDNYIFGFPGMIAEHGLAIFLETDRGNYLLDTGQGKGIINNSLLLGIDLKTLKGIFISHHHWDHTGGLLPVLEVRGEVDIYTHHEFFKESYAIRDNKTRYIGVPYHQKSLELKGARFNFNSRFSEIEPGMWLTGEVPRLTDFERGDKNQVVVSEGKYVPDMILDDQSAVIDTAKGLFVVLGCCHSGIINTLNYIIEKTGKRHIYAVIGGTHLGAVSAEQEEKSIEALKTFDIERIGVSHCTGLKTALRLSNVFGERFFFCNVGTVVEA